MEGCHSEAISPNPRSNMIRKISAATVMAQTEARVFAYFFNPAAQFWTSVIGSLDFWSTLASARIR